MFLFKYKLNYIDLNSGVQPNTSSASALVAAVNLLLFSYRLSSPIDVGIFGFSLMGPASLDFKLRV